MARSRLVLVLVGLALILGSCGGGGGGGVLFGVTSFAGTYWLVLFEPDSSSGDPVATWGTAVSDGAGNVTLDGMANEAGMLSSPGAQALTYTVDLDGTTRFFQGATEVVKGGISGDGNCVILAANSTSLTPLIVVMIRTVGTFSPATLAGDFHISGYSVPGGAESLHSTKAAFDTVSAFSGSGASNTDGTQDGGALSGTYTVATSGQATLTLFGATHEGCLQTGGGFGLFGGGNAMSDIPAIYMLMRAASSASTATLFGSYWAVGIEKDLVGGGFGSIFGTVTADGVNQLWIAGTRYDGTTLGPLTGTAVYGVSSDGTVVADRSGVFGNEDLKGAVSPDGRIALLAGGSVAGSRPLLYILCRK